MPFEIPTLTDLKKRAELSIGTELRKNIVRFSFAKATAYVSAGLAHLLHRHLSYVYDQIFPTKADETSLEEWGIVFGVQRKKPTNAEGRVQISGVKGTPIPLNIEIRSIDTGEIYLVKAGGAIGDSGKIELDVISKNLGSKVNLSMGSGLTLSNPIPGAISSVAMVQEIAGAADIELIEVYRDRLLDYIRSPATGASIPDYIKWTKEVAGVSRAWVLPEAQGAGTVGITYEELGKQYTEYTDAILQKVKDKLEFKRPVTARVVVVKPRPTLISLRIAIKPFNDKTKAIIVTDAADFFFTRFEPLGYKRDDETTVQNTQNVDNLLAILRLRVTSGELTDIQIKTPSPGALFPLQRGQVPYATAQSITIEAIP